MANAPLRGGMAMNIFLIWARPGQIYFLEQDWTGGIRLNWFNNSLFPRKLQAPVAVTIQIEAFSGTVCPLTRGVSASRIEWAAAVRTSGG